LEVGGWRREEKFRLRFRLRGEVEAEVKHDCTEILKCPTISYIA